MTITLRRMYIQTWDCNSHGKHSRPTQTITVYPLAVFRHLLRKRNEVLQLTMHCFAHEYHVFHTKTTSWQANVFRSIVPLWGTPPVTGEVTSQRVRKALLCVYIVSLNMLLNNSSRHRWVGTPLCSHDLTAKRLTDEGEVKHTALGIVRRMYHVEYQFYKWMLSPKVQCQRYDLV